MEDYSYGDEYYTYQDDGSSFRTSFTPYSIDPSMTTRTGAKQYRVSLCFDRLDHACRTTCDALWWLIAESSSPEEKQRQATNAMPKRSHRLRIIDNKDDNTSRSSSAHPADSPPQQQPAPPIKWKVKGNATSLSLQSSSSSGLSSSACSSIGRPSAEGRGKGQGGDRQAVDTQHNLYPSGSQARRIVKPSVTFKANNIDSSKISIGHDKGRDLQTVDSKVLQRRRQQRKIKDAIRFKNLRNPEIIDVRSPSRDEEKARGPKGIPPLAPRQGGSRKQSNEHHRLLTGGILRNSDEGCVVRPLDPATVSPSPSDRWEHIQKSESIGSASIDRVIPKTKSPMPTPAAFWNPKSSTVKDQPIGVVPIPQSLDKMQSVQSTSKIPLTEPQRYMDNQDLATERSSFFVHASRDDVDTPRESVDGIGRALPGHEKHTDVSLPSDCSSIEESASTASPKKAPRRQSPRTQSSQNNVTSSLSVRSFNSARLAKEAFLQSRPSFEHKKGTSRPPSTAVSTTEKARRQAAELSKRHRLQLGGSVSSVDRHMRKSHIQVRREEETMSVY